jgi:hypothetical protein
LTRSPLLHFDSASSAKEPFRFFNPKTASASTLLNRLFFFNPKIASVQPAR